MVPRTPGATDRVLKSRRAAAPASPEQGAPTAGVRVSPRGGESRGRQEPGRPRVTVRGRPHTGADPRIPGFPLRSLILLRARSFPSPQRTPPACLKVCSRDQPQRGPCPPRADKQAYKTLRNTSLITRETAGERVGTGRLVRKTFSEEGASRLSGGAGQEASGGAVSREKERLPGPGGPPAST